MMNSSNSSLRKNFLRIANDKRDRFAIALFILNTLNFIENGDDYYFYCEEMIKEISA